MEMSKRLKIEKESSIMDQSPVAGGTPNKSLNASFTKIGMYPSNFYGGGVAGLGNSRLNLSNFFLDQRINSILGGLTGNGPAAAAKDILNDHSMNLPNSGLLNLSRFGSLPFGGAAPVNVVDNL